MNLNRQIYNIATQGASEGSIIESLESRLPGRTDGPADAYRHLLLAAELTRRYGEVVARGILNVHEMTGSLSGNQIGSMGGQTAEAEDMDRHNNEIGIGIGRTARGWDEVVRRSRQALEEGGEQGDGPRWLPKSDWQVNPEDDAGKRIPTDGPGLNWPPAWPENGAPYPNKENPGQDYNPPDGNANDGDGFPQGDPFTGLPWPNQISEGVSDPFNRAQSIARRDPLTLDLDGNGIETLATSAGVLFDHDADGVQTGSGWIGKNDGFLVWDKSGNGRIDSGRELFGDAFIKSNGQTALNGFDALSDLDSNQDHRVDAQDEHFADLRVWVDADSDGVTDTHELKTLAELGIVAFNTNYTLSNQTLANGNQIAEVGSYARQIPVATAIPMTRAS